MIHMIRDVHPGSRIRNLIFYPSRGPDPGVKKAPDPGSRSATLLSVNYVGNEVQSVTPHSNLDPWEIHRTKYNLGKNIMEYRMGSFNAHFFKYQDDY